MSERPEESQPTQFNIATDQRNAARDYHEYKVPGSIKLFLATSSQQELNDVALDNSRLFYYRFGFEPRTPARQDVLTIQGEGGYTDRDMRLLYRSGFLIVRATYAKLVPNRALPIVGWIQVALFTLLCLGMAFQIAHSTVSPGKQVLGVMALFAAWLGGMYIYHQLFIAAWQAVKRSTARLEE